MRRGRKAGQEARPTGRRASSRPEFRVVVEWIEMDSRRMCPHCRAFITTKDRTCPYCNETVGTRAGQRGFSGLLGGFIPHARFIRILILVVNLGFYIITSIYRMRSGDGGA